MKKISICIPNYNNAPFLQQCLESALAVQYPNKEIVYCDDCSTDDSLRIAKQYADIRIFSNERNLGQPATTNRCLEEATGDYIVILHSDDFLLPTFASTLAPHLDRHPSIGLVIGERHNVDEEGNLENQTPFYDCDCIVPGLEQARISMMATFPPCHVLVRKSVLDKIGRIDERHTVYLDGLLWFKCSIAGGEVGYVREVVCAYRAHPNSTTSQYNRTAGHIIELYNTIMAMVKYGGEHEVIKNNVSKAIKRVGVLALRLSDQSFQEGMYDVTTNYLDFARAFNQDIIHEYKYKLLRFCLEAKDVPPQVLYDKLKDTLEHKRSNSYAPPSGWRPLE